MALPFRRGVGSLALRSFAACLRRHVPPPAAAAAAAAPLLETLCSATTAPICARPLAPPCRHFAAPPQVNKKAREHDDEGPRLNDAIRAPFVRLVIDEGHKVVSRNEALQIAASKDMDLVEVDRKSDPPVCRIMDFHKEKYKKVAKEKEKQKAKSATVLRSGDNKEVRFKGKTEQKDLMVKANQITRLMEQGYKVKCMAMPSNNRKEGEDLGAPLARLLELIQDVCIVESGPHLDSRHAYVIVRHVKFGTKKGGKNASKAIEDAEKGTHGTASELPVDGNERTKWGSEAGDRTISAHSGGTDQNFKRELNQSTANPGNDSEKFHNINSSGRRTSPGHWGPQTSDPRHGSMDANPDLNKRQNNNQVQKPAESNRYAARRPPPPVRGDNQGFSQGRYPQGPRRDENEGRHAMHDNQRPLEQHNRPLPRFNQDRLPQDPRNERRGHIPLNNSQRHSPGGDPGASNPTTKSFGIFSTPKPESRKTNDASEPANTNPPKSYGIFSAKK